MVQLPLDPHELASTVEALHDAVLRRLSWSVLRDFKETWRDNLSLEDAQTIIDTLVSSYAKGMMAFKETDFEKAPDYDRMFSMPEEVWDLLAVFTKAETWSDVPFHEDHDTDCPVCDKFRR